MRYQILFLLSLTACGHDDSQKSTEPAPTASPANIERPAEEPKEMTVEYRRDGDQLALVVADTKDLPACTNANAQQLAWAKSSEQFFSCDGATWQEIAVKGKDGAEGPKGKTGDRGEPGKPPAPNEWVDPVTETRWLIGLPSVNIASADQICAGKWRMPNMLEASAAVQHGLLVVSGTMNGPASLWTVDHNYTGAQGAELGRYFVGPNANAYTSGADLYTNGVFPGVGCIFSEAAP